MSNSPQRRSDMAHVKEGLQPPMHTFIHKWNEPYQPQRVTALWPVLIFRPAEGRKLSWPKWLVTNRGGVPARRRTPIPVLTGPGVK